MTSLGLLQNIWVRDPDRVRGMIDRADDPLEWRRVFIRTFMPKTTTGRRLRAAFGDLFDGIIFENGSDEICGAASASPAPNPAHVERVVERWKPNVILCFGRTACAALSHPVLQGRVIIRGPHPAARRKDTVAELERMASSLQVALSAAGVT